MSGSFQQLLTDATTRAHHVSVMHAFSGKNPVIHPCEKGYYQNTEPRNNDNLYS